MRRFWLIMAALLLGTFVPALALSSATPPAPSGVAKGVDPDASALLEKATRTLVVGSDIFLGDKITTGDKGQVQILFSDGTKLVVGPRSALTIEDYLLRGDGSNGKLIVDALAGSFRFVTGHAAKDRYLITTPTGTIGVRGTGFDFFIDALGLTHVLLYHGSTILCTRDEKCVVLDETCELGEISLPESQVIGLTKLIKGEARDTLRAQFRYAEDEFPLRREFRIAQAYPCLHLRVAEPPPVQKEPKPPCLKGRLCR